MNLLTLFLRTSRRRLGIAIVAALSSGFSTTVLIVIVNQMIRLHGHIPRTFVFTFAALCCVRLVCGIGSHALLVTLSQKALHDLRIELCQQIAAAPLTELEQIGSTPLTTAFGDDLNLIATAFINLPYLFVNAIILVGCLAYLGWLSWQMLLSIGICMSIGALTYWLATDRANLLLRKARHEHETLFHHFRQLIAGTKEIKLNASRRTDFMKDHLAAAADRVRRHNTAGITVYSAAANWGRLLFFIYVGLLLLCSGPGRSATELSACVIVILYMMAPLEAMLNAMPGIAQANVALAHVKHLRTELGIETQTSITQAVRGSSIRWRELALIDVCHRYHRDDGTPSFSLGPINLAVRPGEITFVVGGNGSGKTTLGKLVTALYRPDAGELRLDEELLSRLGQIELRELFAAVFSDFCLFDEFHGIDPVQLKRAEGYLRLLKLDHAVSMADGRLSTTSLSQGQRKRLALLVALLEDRPIYLFDEWAADQDPEFKEIFYRQIIPELARRGKAVIVITHDDRYFDIADQLLRLEQGQLVDSLKTVHASWNSHFARPVLPMAAESSRSRRTNAIRALCVFVVASLGVISCPASAAGKNRQPLAAESFSGIDCLQKAAALLDRPLNTLTLLTAHPSANDVDDTPKALADLVNEQNLSALILPSIASDQIARCPFPIVLHVKGGRYSAELDDYVLCTGVHDGLLHLFCPPSGEMMIPLAELEANRRGEAIIVSRASLPPESGFLRPAIPLVKYGLMLAVLLTLGACAMAPPRRGGLRGLGVWRVFSASCVRVVWLLFASAVLTIVGESASGHTLFELPKVLAVQPIDFLTPQPDASTQPAAALHEISLPIALHLIDTDAVFVDARDPAEYNSGHIRGAMLCPASDIARWRLHLAGVEPHRQIVVYCAEASCHKGEYVATFLIDHGFSNVSLYRDGWAKWSGPKEGS